MERTKQDIFRIIGSRTAVVDECVDSRLSKVLTDAGVKTVAVAIERKGIPDEEVIKMVSNAESTILLTSDRRLHRLVPNSIFIRKKAISPGRSRSVRISCRTSIYFRPPISLTSPTITYRPITPSNGLVRRARPTHSAKGRGLARA